MMKPPICGQNLVLPARITGCGKQIETWGEVYKCTHCDIPFHKECANKHFLDGDVLTEAHIKSMTQEEVDRAYAVLVPNKKFTGAAGEEGRNE
jgi:hypothetical protein